MNQHTPGRPCGCYPEGNPGNCPAPGCAPDGSWNILINEREECRESRNGRIYSRQVITYDVVHNGELVRECATEEEARAAIRQAKEESA